MELNLASLKSVRKFAEEFKERKTPLHYLINNAGTTSPSLEMIFMMLCQELWHSLLDRQLKTVLKHSSAPITLVCLSPILQVPSFGY
jgi:NAD(P)-dependent dehydrogenase (short-subunit alcohol dehydrogenase family)